MITLAQCSDKSHSACFIPDIFPTRKKNAEQQMTLSERFKSFLKNCLPKPKKYLSNPNKKLKSQDQYSCAHAGAIPDLNSLYEIENHLAQILERDYRRLISIKEKNKKIFRWNSLFRKIYALEPVRIDERISWKEYILLTHETAHLISEEFMLGSTKSYVDPGIIPKIEELDRLQQLLNDFDSTRHFRDRGIFELIRNGLIEKKTLTLLIPKLSMPADNNKYSWFKNLKFDSDADLLLWRQLREYHLQPLDVFSFGLEGVSARAGVSNRKNSFSGDQYGAGAAVRKGAGIYAPEASSVKRKKFFTVSGRGEYKVKDDSTLQFKKHFNRSKYITTETVCWSDSGYGRKPLVISNLYFPLSYKNKNGWISKFLINSINRFQNDIGTKLASLGWQSSAIKKKLRLGNVCVVNF